MQSRVNLLDNVLDGALSAFLRLRVPATPPAREPNVAASSPGRGSVHRLYPEELNSHLPFPITTDVLDRIRRTIGQRPAESGAVLGGSRRYGLITHVHLDEAATVSGVTYSPDVTTINRLLRDEWDPREIDFLGFVHSHPGSFTRPSHGDQVYAERILDALPGLDRMPMPVVRTVPDAGSFLMNGFMAVRSAPQSSWRPGTDGSTVRILEGPLVLVDPKAIHPKPQPNPFLSQTRDDCDPAVMASTRIVALSIGESAGYLERMARMGTGQFVLIDPEPIELVTIGTQDVDPQDLGRSKVSALADRLARLNPNCQVWIVEADHSEILDTGFQRLVRDPLPGGPSVIPALTLLAPAGGIGSTTRAQQLGSRLGVPALAGLVATSSQSNGTPPAGTEATPFATIDRLTQCLQTASLAFMHQLNPCAQASHPATLHYRHAAARTGTAG